MKKESVVRGDRAGRVEWRGCAMRKRRGWFKGKEGRELCKGRGREWKAIVKWNGIGEKV